MGPGPSVSVRRFPRRRYTCQQPAAPSGAFQSLPAPIRFCKSLSLPAAFCTNRPPLATAEEQPLPAERGWRLSRRAGVPRGTGPVAMYRVPATATLSRGAAAGPAATFWHLASPPPRGGKEPSSCSRTAPTTDGPSPRQAHGARLPRLCCGTPGPGTEWAPATPRARGCFLPTPPSRGGRGRDPGPWQSRRPDRVGFSRSRGGLGAPPLRPAGPHHTHWETTGREFPKSYLDGVSPGGETGLSTRSTKTHCKGGWCS